MSDANTKHEPVSTAERRINALVVLLREKGILSAAEAETILNM